jgi:hypothetical protein
VVLCLWLTIRLYYIELSGSETMRLRVYERLFRVNWHLTEAARDLQALARELKLDKTALRLLLEQIDETRRDANCALAHEINDRQLAHARKHPSRNWRLRELGLSPRPKAPAAYADSTPLL